MFGTIDDEYLGGNSVGLEFQTKLLVDGLKHNSGEIHRLRDLIHTRGNWGACIRRPQFQIEIVSSS